MNEQMTMNNEIAENVKAESGLVLANGDVMPIVASLDFKKDTSQEIIDRVGHMTVKLINDYTSVAKGYFSMVSSVAILMGHKDYQTLTGIKSIGQYLTEVIKCSKSTASELVKVAKTYYDDAGKMVNSEFSVFSYSELVKLAGYNEEVREAVKDAIVALPNHTRADVIRIADKTLNNLLKIESSESENTDNSENNGSTAEPSENSTESKEVAENKEASLPTVNYKNLYNGIYQKLVNLDLKSMKKDDIVKTIEDITFEMMSNLEN